MEADPETELQFSMAPARADGVIVFRRCLLRAARHGERRCAMAAIRSDCREPVCGRSQAPNRGEELIWMAMMRVAVGLDHCASLSLSSPHDLRARARVLVG